MKFKHTIPIFILLMATFAVGWYLGTSPAPSRLSTMEMRNPAGINNNYDFSNLVGQELAEKSRWRLFADVKILKNEEVIGIELGHFVVRGDDNERQFACGYYSHVTLVFYADGMASNGHVPEMIVQNDCAVSGNVNRLEPIWIPTKRIFSERPGDADFQFTDFATVSMRNIGEEWPTTWYLHSIRLDNPDYSERVIESDHISSGKGPIYNFDL